MSIIKMREILAQQHNNEEMARKIEILKSFLYYESEKNFLKQSIY
jgi:hypothetical protein